MMQIHWSAFLPQFRKTLEVYQGSILFVRKHRLWEGVWQYSWVTRLLIIFALLIGLKFFTIFFHWLQEFSHTERTQMMMAVSGMLSELFTEGYLRLFSGGGKYLMLIFLEVIIFHVSRRTLDILRDDIEADLSFKNFVQAQVRMLKIGIYSWVIELVLGILIGIALSIFGLKWLKPGIIVLVQCALMGWAVVDNYNEQFHLSLKTSIQQTFSRYMGVAFGVGVVLYVLIHIPIVGPIAGPVLAAVTATVVMHDISNIRIRQPRTSAASSETV
ncbi:MAG TPA: hypothetical protein PKD70_02895 [Saprospiraceae bacterium]|nr:hypothetical protein [Saprospiraceae bacterium]HMP12802.1 hypothetical protein [Saprospiraceae bacterium]